MGMPGYPKTLTFEAIESLLNEICSPAFLLPVTLLV